MFIDIGDAALRSSENRFHILVDSIEDYAIYMLDGSGQIITWNRGAQLNKGYLANEVLGHHFRMFFVPEDVATGVPEAELQYASRSGRCAGEGWRLRKSGERFWASYIISAIRDPSGSLTGFAKITRDLTDIKRTHDALLAMKLTLQEERDSLYNAAECTMDALYICEAVYGSSGEVDDFVFSYINRNAEKMSSLSRAVLLGGRMSHLFPAHTNNGLLDRYKDVMLTGVPLDLEMQSPSESTKSPWRRIQAMKHLDGIAITISDIDERKSNELRTEHLATHDNLTGLPNRTLLHDRIGQAIKRASRFGGKVAVFMVNLDSFKRVNDTFGHVTGDGVLVATSVRLQAALRDTDSVIRSGGDEFVVVLSDILEETDLGDCAGKILDSLQSTSEVDGNSIRITCSLGIAVYPDSGHTVDELLHRADAAMYAAKRAGKNQAVNSAPEPRSSGTEDWKREGSHFPSGTSCH